MKNYDSNKKDSIYSYVWFAAGFVLLFFFNGRWILPIAAFLAPLFLIRFLRFHKPLKGFLLLVLAGWFSNIFVWRGMMPISGFFYYFLMFMMSVFTSITFLIDRIYAQKVRGIISTFVFPSAYVIMEYIVVSTNPSGSYGTLVHTQSSLALLQIISITGIWGVTFIILWTASIANWIWDNFFESKKVIRALLAYGIPLMSIILFGQYRLMQRIDSTTVRVASINRSKLNANNSYKENSDSLIELTNNQFLKNCDIAASSGAKIVFGNEALICLKKDNEDEFIEKAKKIAKKVGIYIGLPIVSIPAKFPEVRPENKITWISPQGRQLFTYFKAKPTPGEGKYGDGILKYFDTPYGRISTAICFDMDFPKLISQAGKLKIDIMLVPGNDSEEITPYHTYVSSIRAIEQGFNLVRSASNALSASFNYKGQLLSSLDFFKTNELILYSDVPIKGQSTVYGLLGDYFAWICILFFLIISAIIYKNKEL